MSMSFDDLKAAGRMRDIVERISTGVVNRMRPDERIGKVHHFDPILQYAWILFPGETAPDGLVKVRVGSNFIPTRDYVTYGDECDVVRVIGKPGNLWVADFMKGIASTQVPTGAVMTWDFATPPVGWLIMNGQSTAGYPALAALYGPNLPDRRGLFLLGASATHPLVGAGSTGGAETVTLVSANLAQHAHRMNDHTHAAGGTSGTLDTVIGGAHTHNVNRRIAVGSSTGNAQAGSTVAADDTTGQTGSTHNHSITGHTDAPNTANTENTPAVAATPHENMPPFATVNFIVKT